MSVLISIVTTSNFLVFGPVLFHHMSYKMISAEFPCSEGGCSSSQSKYPSEVLSKARAPVFASAANFLHFGLWLQHSQ